MISATLASPILRILSEVYAEVGALPSEGKVADYIPELKKADPAWFGAVITTADGQTYAVGDVDVPFTIQSISKPFVYGMVLDACGLGETLAKVGVEPSGEAFNSISLYPGSGRPYNPMINAGAIASAGMLHSLHGERTVHRMLQTFSRLAGSTLTLDDAVFESERVTGHRNRAIAHLLRNFDILTTDAVDAPLNAYFAQCSVRVTCRELAMMGATLANGGENPATGQRALSAENVPRILSVMNSCGMYDYSGEWGFRVGLPAKSGVGGGVLAVLPGQLAIAVFSPLLDAQGNSVRGIRVCEELARRLGLHMLNTPRFGAGVIRSELDAEAMRSRRPQRANRERAEEHGKAIRVLQAQGDLSFATVELITRRLLERFDETRGAVLDLHRVNRIDAVAIELLSSLVEAFESAEKSLILARCRQHGALIDALLGRRDRERPIVADDLVQALEMCEEALLGSVSAHSPREREVPLRDQRLMHGMTADELGALEAHTVRRSYRPREVIVREGDPSEDLYFVTEGRVSVVLGDPEEPSAVVAQVPAGLCFGEMALIERAPRSASIRADLKTTCLSLPFDALARPELASVQHKLLRNLALDLAERLRRVSLG